jgi:signal transduction histidine kinase
MQAIMAGTRAISRGTPAPALAETGVAEARELARGINAMARDLEHSRAALLEHERQAALGALVPVVAHNIRNPLAAIRANAQLIDAGEGADDLVEIRQAILDTADRLGRWVNSLVSYLHPLHPERRKVAAVELLAAAQGLVEPRLEQLGVRCTRARWDESAILDADRDLLEQALYGLLLNAVEASPAGTTITLAVERADGHVRLIIRDQAGGIPFAPEPSGLTPGPTTKRFGTGLGIPIAFKICKTHGYALEFDSVAGVGTEVVISAAAAGVE